MNFIFAKTKLFTITILLIVKLFNIQTFNLPFHYSNGLDGIYTFKERENSEKDVTDEITEDTVLAAIISTVIFISGFVVVSILIALLLSLLVFFFRLLLIIIIIITY